MSDSILTYIIAPLVTAAIGGIGFIVRYYIKKRDEKHEEEMKERNQQRDDIKKKIAELKIENLQWKSALLGCDNPECPAKKIVAEYYKKKGELQ